MQSAVSKLSFTIPTSWVLFKSNSTISIVSRPWFDWQYLTIHLAIYAFGTAASYFLLKHNGPSALFIFILFFTLFMSAIVLFLTVMSAQAKPNMVLNLQTKIIALPNEDVLFRDIVEIGVKKITKNKLFIYAGTTSGLNSANKFVLYFSTNTRIFYVAGALNEKFTLKAAEEISKAIKASKG